jgi:hypothetical protein
MVLLCVALTLLVNKNWIWFTILVGANLQQSALTNWRPIMWLFKEAGTKLAQDG